MEEKCATLNEKYLYALAQMKDLHKTYEKENAISVKYVTHDLMLELLPIIDVFSMVLENPNVPNEVSKYSEDWVPIKNIMNGMIQLENGYYVIRNVTGMDTGFKFIHKGDWKGSVEEVTAACERDNFMSAAEACEYGLIDKIL